ncbi:MULTISPECIES: aminopeptidase [Pseudomonas syringae group]|uniref:Putative aminopeptidase n=2 Tax=Pseudomonas syringae group TaxID=136849 RepID=A0A0P9QMF4_PSESX|nr:MULTISPECIES: aminopeptidase [Pseudomonas syringae group]KPW99159.1 putative aminopeptidase [Pseudomonas syringae pv. cerasicola]KWS84359.1 aminopeptidase [Pseudomonas syringae pv. cerasicola]PHN70424.1 aminopeptidase [Pseudomonas syringae pv. cerasicola]PHN71943.1 aminopeptidase [Pseudomonas syringae pv. cerasicola]RMS71796.1 putative aminopeptidase [Pseudomonas savastanoi]
MSTLTAPRLCRVLSLMAVTLLAGCSSVSYYGQLAQGQWQLLQAREPVAKIVADPKRDAGLRERLARSQLARTFASEHLHLPDNKSYRLYADLGRPYVVWNVFATDEFSLEPVTHCFPIAGCVAYRGYYSPGGARGEAALQRQAGKDVYLSGVEAYSTLGWFNDPILSSMMGWGDERLATLIFHELAHQRFYVKDDTEFNESYASFVEQEGTRQWRAARGLPPESVSQSARRDQFIRSVLDTRERLKALYRQPLSAEVMRAHKAEEFERLRSDYRKLRDEEWAGDKRFDAWINSPMNNAKLLPFGLYDQWVPAFAALFRQVNGDWVAFFNAVEKLGGLPVEARKAALQRLMP